MSGFDATFDGFTPATPIAYAQGSGEYSRAIATAQRLIAKKGLRCTWHSNRQQENAEKPWRPLDNNDTPVVVPMLFLPTGRVGDEFRSLLQGTEIPQGAEMALMGAVTFEPALTDTIQRFGQTLRLKTIDRIAPNGLPVLWVLGVVQ